MWLLELLGVADMHVQRSLRGDVPIILYGGGKNGWSQSFSRLVMTKLTVGVHGTRVRTWYYVHVHMHVHAHVHVHVHVNCQHRHRSLFVSKGVFPCRSASRRIALRVFGPRRAAATRCAPPITGHSPARGPAPLTLPASRALHHTGQGQARRQARRTATRAGSAVRCCVAGRPRRSLCGPPRQHLHGVGQWTQRNALL